MEANATQPVKDAPRKDTRRARATLLGASLILALLVLWLQARSMDSWRDTLDRSAVQLAQMRADALEIASLRDAPKAAAGRTRANEELLAQVERALKAAGIARDRWHDSIPQPPARRPGSDYRRLSTRLYFEAVTLKEVASFVHHLRAGDPTLGASSLNLTNRTITDPHYDIDLAVSYEVYDPRSPRSWKAG